MRFNSYVIPDWEFITPDKLSLIILEYSKDLMSLFLINDELSESTCSVTLPIAYPSYIKVFFIFFGKVIKTIEYYVTFEPWFAFELDKYSEKNKNVTTNRY